MIMADWRKIIDYVLKWEGGLVRFANENQWTNKGIQFTTFQMLAKKLLSIDPTFENFENLTRDQATEFIKYYWDIATDNNSINNQESANLMFQAVWGSGKSGLMDMQRALNQAFKTNLSIDGIVGPQTVNVINRHNSGQVLYNALVQRYERLAANNPDYSLYLNGWLNRIAELKPLIAGTGLLLIGFFFFNLLSR